MAGAPYSFDVTDTSAKAVPERNIKTAVAWVTGTAYPQGVIVKSDHAYYMAMAAGTSGANAPVHRRGIASDGTVNWLYVPEGPRISGSLVNESGNDLYLSVGFPAVASEGILLAANGGFYNIPDEVQGPIHLIGAVAGPSSVLIQEV